MPVFGHRSISPDGDTVSGNITATTRAVAARRLVQQGFSPIDISLGRLTIWSRLQVPMDQLKTPSRQDVYAFTRDLCRLTTAGLPSDRALALTHDSAQNLQFRQTLGAVYEHVRKGKSLAGSLSEFSSVFSATYVATIKAGETAGQLSSALSQLEIMLQRQIRFSARVRSALVYPALLLTVVLATLVIVVTVVLPQFAPLFEASEHEPPLITRAVLGFGFAVKQYGLWFLFVILAGFGLGLRILKDPARQSKIGRRALRMTILSRPDVIATLRTLGGALSGGVPMDQAIALATSTAWNPALRNDLSAIAGKLRRGQFLTTALHSYTWVEPMVLQMARLEEETGRLGELLLEAASVLEEEYEFRLERFLGLLGPVLTLVMGGIVAVLVGGVLLGLMSVSQSI